MSPTAIFLFKWLQQNASSLAKSGTDGRKWGFNDLLETSGIGWYGKKVLAWKASVCVGVVVVVVVGGSFSEEPDWKLFMGQRGQTHPRTAPARILKFSLMSFCSPLMAAQLRQWAAKGSVGEEGKGAGGPSDLFYHHVALYGSYHWRWAQMLLSSGGGSAHFA